MTRAELRGLLKTLATRAGPAAATPEWRGRAAVAWALLAPFEHEGRRYLLLREEDALATARALLSRRELEVLLALVPARTNKAIAVTLGIAPSTVGVLLSRAGRKLQLSSRRALTELAQRLAVATTTPE